MRPEGLFFLVGDAVHPFRWHGIVVLVLVPLAKPQDVFWCGWDSTYRARFGLVCIPGVDGCLYPSIQIVLLWGLELLPHLSVGVPVQTCEQVSIVCSACQSVCALPLRLLGEGELYLPPWSLEADLLR